MPQNAASTAAANAASANSAIRRPRLEAAIGWLAAAGLVFLLSAVVVLAVESRQRAIGEAMQRAESAAQILSEHAARLFDATDLLVEHAAEQTQDLTWDEVEGSRRIWESLHGEVARLPFLDGVWLNDGSGRLRMSTVGFPPPASNAGDRDFFRAHLSGPERPYISGVFVGRVTGKPTFLVSRRLSAPDGSFRGIASVTVDPSYFESFYRRLDLPYDPVILLFRAEDYSVLVRHPEPNPLAPAPVPDFGRRAVEANPISGVTVGERAIFAHRRVENWPIHVAVRTNLDPVLAAWRSGLAAYAGLAAAAATALLALSAFGFRQAKAARLVRERLEARVRERTASLESALAQRDEVLAQKDLLMREVNHRIKNSLQVVSSLLALQGQGAQTPEARASLNEAGRRVRAVSDIHQLLYKVDDVRLVPFHDYLTALCRDVERSALADSGDWRLKLAVEPVQVPTDQAVPLGLIANELLMNAVKHAYPDGGPKPITVGLSPTDGGVRLTIADEGAGLPEGFDWRRSGSLGMRLVHALSSQLGTTLSVERLHPGTRFTVDVSLAPVA
ncbi:sensor histidine kinase [Azospirillum sp. sgz302134]